MMDGIFKKLFALLLSFSMPFFISAEEIRIGGIYGLTGPLAEMGADFRDGAILAAEELSKNPEQKLLPIIEDAKWQPKEAVAAFEKLSSIDNVKFFHTTGSAVSFAIKPLAEKKKVLLFVSAAHPELGKNSTFVIRHGNMADFDARNLANAVLGQKPKKIAVIYIQDDWGYLFDNVLKQEFSKKSPALEYRSASHLPTVVDPKSEVTSLLSQKPDTFILATYGASISQIMKTLRQNDFKGKVFINNGLVLSADPKQVVKESGLKNFWYQDYLSLPEEFLNLYMSRFKRNPGYFAMAAYTDFELLHHAIVKVGYEPEKVVQYIKSLGKFEGRFESLDIQADGCMRVPIVVKRWESSSP